MDQLQYLRRCKHLRVQTVCNRLRDRPSWPASWRVFFRYAGSTGYSDGACMREVSDHDLTLSQLKTLSLLSELPPASPLSLKDVAARLGISLPAASRAVDPLVRRGLVVRREDEEDRG